MGKNKNPKNSYYFFMMEFKEKSGQKFKDNKEIAEAASPHWSKLTAEQRKPYEEKAKLAKNNKGDKYTSTGQKIDVVQNQVMNQAMKEMAIREHINEMIRNALGDDSIADMPFYIVHVNYFCFCNTHPSYYIPAEIAICKFTLRNGVSEGNVFHEIVRPGEIPIGYKYEADKTSDSTHQLTVPQSGDANNLFDVTDNVMKFLRIKSGSRNSSTLPPLYALESNLPIAEDVLKNLCVNRRGYDETCINVYPLQHMFFILRNAINDNRPYPSISSSRLELEKDVYDFCKTIPCNFHQNTDVGNYCSRSYAIRLSYIICDNCCADLGIDLIPGQHIPSDSLVAPSRPVSRLGRWSSSASAVTSTDNETYQSDVAESDTESCSGSNASLFISNNESDVTQDTEWIYAGRRKQNSKNMPKRTTKPNPVAQASSSKQENVVGIRRPVTTSFAYYATSQSSQSSVDNFSGPVTQLKLPSSFGTTGPLSPPYGRVRSAASSINGDESSVTYRNSRTPSPARSDLSGFSNLSMQSASTTSKVSSIRLARGRGRGAALRNPQR